jgi:hypothetical protein
MRYLAGTRSKGILYSKRSDIPDNGSLVSYSDSDWAEDSERRSVSGLLFKLAGGPISWISRRQPTVSLSSTEAEYIAMNEAGREMKWLYRLLNCIGATQSLPLELRCDNQSAIRTAIKDGNMDRRKHIDVKHHWIREQLEGGIIKLVWTPSTDNEADLLTKALTPMLFLPFRDQVLGYIYGTNGSN